MGKQSMMEKDGSQPLVLLDIKTADNPIETVSLEKARDAVSAALDEWTDVEYDSVNFSVSSIMVGVNEPLQDEEKLADATYYLSKEIRDRTDTKVVGFEVDYEGSSYPPHIWHSVRTGL